MNRFANPIDPLFRATLVLGTLLASMAASAQTTLASSYFTQSNEGWTLFSPMVHGPGSPISHPRQ